MIGEYTAFLVNIYVCTCIRDEVCLICTCTCYGIRSILSLQKQDHAKKKTPLKQ